VEQLLQSPASRIHRRHKSARTSVPTHASPAVAMKCAAGQVTGSRSAYTAVEVLAVVLRGSFAWWRHAGEVISGCSEETVTCLYWPERLALHQTRTWLVMTEMVKSWPRLFQTDRHPPDLERPVQRILLQLLSK